MKRIPEIVVLGPIFCVLVGFVLVQAMLGKIGLVKVPPPMYGRKAFFK